MGLFYLIVITGETLLQDLWVRKFDWDDPIEDQTVRQVWTDLQMDLKTFQSTKCKVQRYIGTEEKDGNVYNIVCFCNFFKEGLCDSCVPTPRK